MDAKIINIALQQLRNTNQEELFKEAFFKEYFRVFRHNKGFKINVIENINLEDVIKLSDRLVSIFIDKLSMLSKLGIDNHIGMIIFIGDGKVDGHAIMLDGMSYIFIDLAAGIRRITVDFNWDVFISHEIIHALYYKFNKAFYPGQYMTNEEIYMKRLIDEGMATYMSIRIFQLEDSLGYWLGLLKADEVKKWIVNCKKMKIAIGMQLEKIINSEVYDKSLYNRLFCIEARESILTYRLGYYYGVQIIKDIDHSQKIEDIFNLSYNEVKGFIRRYFKQI